MYYLVTLFDYLSYIFGQILIAYILKIYYICKICWAIKKKDLLVASLLLLEEMKKVSSLMAFTSMAKIRSWRVLERDSLVQMNINTRATQP